MFNLTQDIKHQLIQEKTHLKEHKKENEEMTNKLKILTKERDDYHTKLQEKDNELNQVCSLYFFLFFFLTSDAMMYTVSYYIIS